jgi:hypothetical protein
MIKFFALLAPAILFGIRTQCQQVKPPLKQGTITSVKKFKPPVVKSFLGRNTKTTDVSIDEANQLLSLPLRVTDDKNIQYTISSYQFLYRKKSVIENEQTGRKETVFTTVADIFKSTPLPEIWIKNIAGGLQKDEELYFFDIIVTDKLNRKFFAPDLKIRIL